MVQLNQKNLKLTKVQLQVVRFKSDFDHGTGEG